MQQVEERPRPARGHAPDLTERRLERVRQARGQAEAQRAGGAFQVVRLPERLLDQGATPGAVCTALDLHQHGADALDLLAGFFAQRGAQELEGLVVGAH